MADQLEIDEMWEAFQEESQYTRDSYLVVERMAKFYQNADEKARVQIRRTLPTWLRGEDVAKRYVALYLVDHFQLRELLPGLRRLRHDVQKRAGPEVPFLLDKIERFIASLESQES